MARSSALLLSLFLLGCASTAPADVQVQCLPMRGWTPPELAAFDAEFKGLQDGKHPMTIQAITEYLQMRDADRACINAPPKTATWGGTTFKGQ